MTKPFRFYNTRTRDVEPFTPLKPGRVGIYSCGPTVYNFAHIGNLRAYVFVDTLKRALLWGGYQTYHVMNLTDVGHLTDDADAGEDKMELAAKRTGRDIWDLSRYYSAVFFEHTGDLGILPPDVVCRATDHIQQQIDLIQRMEAAGATYAAGDGIYLDTAKVPGYADFARLSVDGQRAGARVEVVEGKRNPTDFAVWKFAQGKKRLMEWDSPWGVGFPGWHLECSAMATHYLGEHFDIHTGGIDHIPVHHTNEIAQMRAASGNESWVEVWMHNNFLVLDKGDSEPGEKMAKSAGGFITLDTVRSWGVPPLAYRFFLLGTHYRKEVKFSQTNLEAAAGSLNRLYKHVAELQTFGGQTPGDPMADSLAGHRQRFEEAIADDLNTPRALAEVWGAVRDTALAPADVLAFVEDADRVLGLRLKSGQPASAGASRIDGAKIEAVIKKRTDARKAKDFATADAVRDVCEALGIKLKDGPDGTTWELE